MKSNGMDFEAIMAQLRAAGSQNTRRLYALSGAGENQFGVSLGFLRPLAKKVKVNHSLALKLWSTGNIDAMILATMIMDPMALSASEIESMLQPLTYYRLVDEFTRNIVAKTPFGDELCQRWLKSESEFVGRAGWTLLSARIAEKRVGGLDLKSILKTIEGAILKAPVRKQEAMNCCLVYIGIHVPQFTQECIELGERLGRFDKRPVPKGCTSPYAPEWISVVLKKKAKV